MFKRHDLIAPYREKSPDPDSPGSAGGSSEEVAPSEDLPEDHGQDTVSEESLWESLATDDDADDSDEEAPVAEEEETPEPEPEEPPPVEEPEPEPEQEETPSEPEPEPEPQPEPPQPTETDEQRAERQKKFEAHLEERFALSDEEALQLQMEPKVAFPKLMSRIIADMYNGVMASVQQQMPEAIQYYNTVHSAQEQATDRFFKAWPKLNRKEHGASVKQVAQVYAQLNDGKELSEEQIVRDVGLQVMAMHGIQPEIVIEDNAGDPPPPPRTPPATTQHTAPPKQSGNIFEQMAEELLDEDL